MKLIVLAALGALTWSSAARAEEDAHRWLLVGRTFYDSKFEFVVVGTFTTNEACLAAAKSIEFLGLRGATCLDRGPPA